MKNKSCLIIYPILNIYSKKQAGGVAHLLANVKGYNENDIKCISLCSFNFKMIVKKGNNIYLNIVVPCTNKSFDLKNPIQIGKRFFGSFYELIIQFIIFLSKPNIIHERANNRLSLISKLKGSYKKIYEINDLYYTDINLTSANLNLVIDKNIYPKGHSYFERTWPVDFKFSQQKKDGYQNKIIYVGSGMYWHDFDKMNRILKYLNKKDSNWSLDVYGPKTIKSILPKEDYIFYKGFLDRNKFNETIRNYNFGFAIYNNNYGSDRNMVGSPMKILDYLASNIKPITNILSMDLRLKFKDSIISINGFDEETIANNLIKVKDLNIDFENNSRVLDNNFSPKAYINDMLKELEKG